MHPTDAQRATTPLASPKTVAKHARLRPNTHAPEDDGARREPPAASFPSVMLFSAAEASRAAEPQAEAQRGALGFALSVSAAVVPSRLMRALRAKGRGDVVRSSLVTR